MKKFTFSLDTVLRYKEQVLDELKRQHGVILADIVQKESEIKVMELDRQKYIEDFNKEKEMGLPIFEAINRESHLHVLEYYIKEEYKKLERLQEMEKIKRREVVEARTETASMEKLKEKQVEEYNKMAAKADEQFVEEFVMNKRALLGV